MSDANERANRNLRIATRNLLIVAFLWIFIEIPLLILLILHRTGLL